QEACGSEEESRPGGPAPRGGGRPQSGREEDRGRSASQTSRRDSAPDEEGRRTRQERREIDRGRKDGGDAQRGPGRGASAGRPAAFGDREGGRETGCHPGSAGAPSGRSDSSPTRGRAGSATRERERSEGIRAA